MSDPRPMDLYRRAAELAAAGGGFAMALVLSAEGSTPRKAGVRAIVNAAGGIFGTIGGGDVEAEVQRRAVAACRSQRPAVFSFDLHAASAGGAAPICGGTMRFLIDPTADKDAACYARAADALGQRRRGVLLTTVRTAAATEVHVTWLAEDSLTAEAPWPGAEAIGKALARETPELLRQDAPASDAMVEAFVEPVIPQPVLLIVGGGHVGQALARQAVEVGFDVTVLDDRPEFTQPGLLPEPVTTRCGPIGQQVGAFGMTRDTYVVIVTRGHQHDAEALAACIHASRGDRWPAAYIGMIGSKRKVGLIRQRFLESGLATEAELARVFAPIGLDIGAVTVPEIAMSITAELIAVRRKGPEIAPVGHMVAR